MTDPIDHVKIEIPCERCGNKTKKTVGWVRTHSQLTCRCGMNIVFDADQFKGEIARAEKSFAELYKTEIDPSRKKS